MTQILIRRGTVAALAGITLANGELGWTTDTHQLYLGDGATAGGNLIGPFSGSAGNNSGSTHVTGARPTINAAGTTNISPGAKNTPYSASFSILAGGAPFIANLVLIGTSATQGDLIKVSLLLPAGTNPTIKIYNASTGGTLLDTVTCDGSATPWIGFYTYNGSAWEKDFSAFQNN